MGAGSVLGALAAGARGTVGPGVLVTSAALFGVAELLAALAPTLETMALALIPLGAASVTFAAGVNSSLQLESADALRGRVMALYAMVFLGSTAIGAPLIGWLAQVAGPARRAAGRRRGRARDRGRGRTPRSPRPRPPRRGRQRPAGRYHRLRPGWVAQLVRAHDS